MRGDWVEPVEIELGRIGLYTVIPDTGKAAETLLYKWPVDDGPVFSRAKQACLAVLEGQAEPDTARQAFIAAADEAGLSTRRAQRYIPEGRSVGQRWGKRRTA